MPTQSPSSDRFTKDVKNPTSSESARAGIRVALLTGGFDKSYAFGLATTLGRRGLCLDVIGSDEVDSPELHGILELSFLNLRGSMKENTNFAEKVKRVLVYYARLIGYSATAKPKIFHILWNNKFQFIDRTLLMLYYKGLGKKIVLTAHNVNSGKRDSNDSWINRLTLRIQYLLADHIFIHTVKMQRELLDDFGVPEKKTSVIPFGINNSVPQTDLSSTEAKQQLDIRKDERTILFFGGIRPYKGLEYLVEAFASLLLRHPDYRLIIAGHLKEGAEPYLQPIQRKIEEGIGRERIIQRIQAIPDKEIELFFKAADVLALPYRNVSQSGVLFLAYSFGLPVVATDVGSIRDDILEGQTGFLCKPSDAVDLARALEKYFESDLFKNLESLRGEIQDKANATHSWEIVGEKTRQVYLELLGGHL